jgi:hypothetical protein
MHSEHTTHEERRVHRKQGDQQIESGMSSRHALLVRAIAIKRYEAVDQQEQQNSLRLHFTTPASGLEAVA